MATFKEVLAEVVLKRVLNVMIKDLTNDIPEELLTHEVDEMIEDRLREVFYER